MTVYTSYQDYLASSDWKQRRARILKRDNYQCKMCGTGMNLSVHHIRYPKEFGKEPDDDLITVCDSCHKMIHDHDLKRKRNAAEERKMTDQHMRKWAEKAKRRDFLYGGMENMCVLRYLQDSKKDYEEENHCQLWGVAWLQTTLGYAHWLLVNEMYKFGYSLEDISLRVPLDKKTIEKYLAADRSNTEMYWSNTRYITIEEIKSQVRKYIETES